MDNKRTSLIDNPSIYLSKALEFEVEYCKEGIYYTNEEYRIYAYGRNEAEAVMSIYNEIAMLYLNYTTADDKVLTKKAIELKHKLKKLVRVKL